MRDEPIVYVRTVLPLRTSVLPSWMRDGWAVNDDVECSPWRTLKAFGIELSRITAATETTNVVGP